MPKVTRSAAAHQRCDIGVGKSRVGALAPGDNCSHGRGALQRSLRWLLVEHRGNPAAQESIAAANGIHDIDSECRLLLERPTIEQYNPVSSHSHADGVELETIAQCHRRGSNVAGPERRAGQVGELVHVHLYPVRPLQK